MHRKSTATKNWIRKKSDTTKKGTSRKWAQKPWCYNGFSAVLMANIVEMKQSIPWPDTVCMEHSDLFFGQRLCARSIWIYSFVKYCVHEAFGSILLSNTVCVEHSNHFVGQILCAWSIQIYSLVKYCVHGAFRLFTSTVTDLEFPMGFMLHCLDYRMLTSIIHVLSKTSWAPLI